MNAWLTSIRSLVLTWALSASGKADTISTYTANNFDVARSLVVSEPSSLLLWAIGIVGTARRRRLRMLASIVIISTSTAASLVAQTDCSSLLNHGIFNRLRTSNSAASAAAASSQLCTAYHSLDQSSSSKSGGVTAIGYGSGSFSLSDQQLKEIGSSLCTSSSSDQQAQQNLDTYRSTIDPTIVSAFVSCMDLATKDGLIVGTQYDENSQDHLVIQAHYSTPPTGQKSIAFTDFAIDQPLDSEPSRKVTCAGSLQTAAQNKTWLTNRVVTVTCRRPIVADPSKAFYAGGNLVLAAPVTITVGTSAGAFSRTLEAVMPGPPPVPDLPVGTIAPMFLSPSQLQNLKPKWLPADGSKVTDTSSPLFGQTLPDLKDKFVYGSSVAIDTTSMTDTSLVGGSLKGVAHVDLSGTTGGTQMVNEQIGAVATVHPPNFVIDTATNEDDYADHNHTIRLVGDQSTDNPPPPYRRLVYMVKCR